MSDCEGGEAVVFDVDESGFLKAFEDGGGGLGFLVGCTVEEEGEVDELWKGLVNE